MAATDNQYPFLKGGGEMGKLIRNLDWSATPLGPPDQWPQSLRTTIGLLISSRFPMFLFWGPELLCFYNDAYRPSLGDDGKHPGALGRPAKDIWQEAWHSIGPMIDQILAGGEAIWLEDQLIPFYRNGVLEDVYGTFSYSAVPDETGEPAGVIVTCMETTSKVETIKRQTDSREQLEFAIAAAELGTWDLNPATNKFTGNDRLKRWFGLQPDEDVDLNLALAVIAPEERQQVSEAIARAMQYESGGKYDIEYTLINPLTQKTRIVRAKGRAWFGEDKVAYRLNGTLQDITTERKAQREIRETQELADIALRSAGIGLFQLSLSESKVSYSPLFAKIMTGNEGHKDLTRELFRSHVHPDDIELRDSFIEKAIKEGAFAYQPRAIWDDGTVHRIQVQGGTIYDNDHNAKALTGTVRDITEFEAQALALKESENKLRSLIEKTPVATALFRGKDLIIDLANEVMIGYWQKGTQVIGKPYREAVPELEGQGYFEQLEEVFRTGKEIHTIGRQANINDNGTTHTSYFNYSYTPLFDESGEVYAVLNMGSDVTESIVSQQRIEESQRVLLQSFEDSPVGIAIISRDDLIFRMANPFYGALIGRKPADIIGKSLLEALPEMEGQGFELLLQDVVETGNPFIGKEVPVEVLRNGELEWIYVDLTYQARREIGGTVSGILVVAIDVTQQVLTRKKIEESEARFRALIEQAPVATCLFTGTDMKVEIINKMMVTAWGKDFSVKDKPLLKALPELRGQPFMDILTEVYTTGKTYEAKAAPVDLIVEGVLGTYYYDFTYKPVFDEAGNVYGIINVSVNVTERVMAMQQLEEAELNMRGAVELAQLGTWSIEVATNGLSYSDRLIEWFGYDPAAQDYTQVIPILESEDQERVARAVAWALNPESQGIYDEIYTVIHPRTGQKRVLHAHGKAVFDASGKPIRMNGTAQDITLQQQLQATLEAEVQERTEELAVINEELQATNEELAATNEELEESNSQLMHSNDDLAQYAYVASHDLQEPLRKIRIFSDVLSRHKGLEKDSYDLVEKISQSAERMTQLIRDLLEFSRLLKPEALMRPVSLTEVVAAVKVDFELTIGEKHAVIETGALPVIEAVGLQMNQLFYNLVSNALKFSMPDKAPLIRITSTPIADSELLKYIPRPLAFSQYHHIIISDNGIGFDAQYSEQIFEVFKRLHGREQYAGSGIGLALCRRIVSNHTGVLFAESARGLGSIFHIILPEQQQHVARSLPDGFEWNAD